MTTPTRQSASVLPLFFQSDRFQLLIVGAGQEALALLNMLLLQAPSAQIRVAGHPILPAIAELAQRHPTIKITDQSFDPVDLTGCHLAFIATGDPALDQQIKTLATKQGILANVASAPDSSDFQFAPAAPKSGLLKKKRVFEYWTPANPHPPEGLERIDGRHWRRIATGALTAFGLLLLGNLVYITGLHEQIAPEFWPFLAIGFFAQMIDGLLGMGYGTTAAIGLMTMNVPLAAVSSSIHTAEMFASGASGYSHYRFGNVKKELFRALLLPGVVGAICGALLLSWLDGRGAEFVKPLLAVYMLALGIRILYRVFRPSQGEKEIKRVGLLAGIGGFLDSFGGGGWGPLVTGTLINKGKTPRYVIGSVSLSEFFVTLASAITFFAAIGIGHWPVILGLTVGGVLAAPLAARLTGRLPVKNMMIGVGLMIILWSLVVLVRWWW